MKGLEEKRRGIGERMVQVGDIRQGSLYERSLKCGKSGCRCAVDKSYLHGPHYFLTKKIEGKTVQRTIPKGAVESTKAQVARFQEFRKLTQEFLAVNEEICEAKVTEPGIETDH